MTRNVVLAYIILFTYIINILWLPLFDIIYYMLYPEQLCKRDKLDIEVYITSWAISPLSFSLSVCIMLCYIIAKIMTFIFKPLQEIVQIILDRMEK